MVLFLATYQELLYSRLAFTSNNAVIYYTMKIEKYKDFSIWTWINVLHLEYKWDRKESIISVSFSMDI